VVSFDENGKPHCGLLPLAGRFWSYGDMYEAYFDLKRRPFSNTPNPADYFPGGGHEEAFKLLNGFLSDGDGIAVVVGPAGVGKTLLGHRLLDVLKPTQQPIFLTNNHTSTVAALYQAILYDLSLPFQGVSEQELRLKVTDFLMERFSEGERTVLLLDEAQHLCDAQMEELRLLTNLESRRQKAIQVVLLAQPKLATMLERPDQEPMSQRVGVVARLCSFTSDEILEYVHTQMERAGGSADAIFTAGALVELCERSAGIPRRINQLCHRAMLLAFGTQAGAVDAEHVASAADQLLLPRSRRGLVVHHSEAVLESAIPRRFTVPDPLVESTPAPAHVYEVGAQFGAPHDDPATVKLAQPGPRAPRRA
jgi:type II secretory pathway predicted ATPase ExeA